MPDATPPENDPKDRVALHRGQTRLFGGEALGGQIAGAKRPEFGIAFAAFHAGEFRRKRRAGASGKKRTEGT
jgi:hypothetical protein